MGCRVYCSYPEINAAELQRRPTGIIPHDEDVAKAGRLLRQMFHLLWRRVLGCLSTLLQHVLA